MDFSETSPEKEVTPDAIPPGVASIRVECAGAGPPLVIRVRRAAKWLLRTHGLRAVAIDLPDENSEAGK